MRAPPRPLPPSPGVSDVTLCRSNHYDLLYVDHQAYTDADGSHDGYTDGPGPHPRTYGSYGWEIFMDYLRSRDEIIFTSSLHGAPEFLYSQSVEVEYLPGWDESFLSAPRGEEDALHPPQLPDGGVSHRPGGHCHPGDAPGTSIPS